MFHARLSRRRFVAAAVFLSCGSGCGTILYPERRGQPAGPLDLKVVALDAIGLLFFFVPGVIAFAVDFSNGTIYLPAEDCATRPQRDGSRRLLSQTVPRSRLSLPGLSRVVSDHLGRTVELEPERCDTRRLADLADFWPVHDECAAARPA